MDPDGTDDKGADGEGRHDGVRLELEDEVAFGHVWGNVGGGGVGGGADGGGWTRRRTPCEGVWGFLPGSLVRVVLPLWAFSL